MPMLDYKCEKCDTVYEILTEKEKPICPNCNSKKKQSIVPPSCGKPIIH